MPLTIRAACIVTLAVKATAATLKFAVEGNYPPYAFRNKDTGAIEGFGPDIAVGMTKLCSDVNIQVIDGKWSDCWTSAGGGALGPALANGSYDACMTYTHTYGVRTALADFSYGILDLNKAAGLMTRVFTSGSFQKPALNGWDNLAGKIVADVGGWAPTADGLGFVTNKCTGKKYAPKCSGDLKPDCYKLVVANADAENGLGANDVALNMLIKTREVDAVFLYADQASQYAYHAQCAPGAYPPPAWDCKQWQKFGEYFAYIQTGQFGYAQNGTTLAMTKKGSGVDKKINPCLDKYMQTKEYYDVCKKHGMEKSCFPNSHFPSAKKNVKVFDKPTPQQTGPCAVGYCACPTEPVLDAAGRDSEKIQAVEIRQQEKMAGSDLIRRHENMAGAGDQTACLSFEGQLKASTWQPFNLRAL